MLTIKKKKNAGKDLNNFSLQKKNNILKIDKKS